MGLREPEEGGGVLFVAGGQWYRAFEGLREYKYVREMLVRVARTLDEWRAKSTY